MMNRLKYLLAGALFGTILYKSEVISWYRIQEMFRFQSFHMYGIFGAAVATGAISLFLVRRANVRSRTGQPLDVGRKKFTKGTLIGGIIFGMGWALTGACPGPLYVHVGAGTSVMIVALVSATFGAWVYGYVRPKLPH